MHDSDMKPETMHESEMRAGRPRSVEGETPTLRIRNLSLSMGGSCLLDDVSLSVEAGEKVAVVGANGAGKTTLLKCLLGLMTPDAGRIEVNGVLTSDYSRMEMARQLAYVPQLLEASVPFTVLDFVMMGRYAHEGGFSLADDEGVVVAKEALARIGMTRFSHRTIQTLSGGERQKICIAAALVQQSSILVLDEPSAHLDPRQREEVHELLSEIAQSDDLTLLTVTHDLNWAAMDFDRIIGMSEGRVIADGVPKDLMTTENLHAIFGVEFLLCPHPETGKTMVIPSVRKEMMDVD